jgi:ankyrin repeat protein
VELPLKHGAQPDFEDEYGRTPLSQAVMKGDETIVELLLRCDPRLDLKCGFGWTLLSHAVEQGSVAIVQLLLPHEVGLKSSYIYKIVR